MESKVEARIYLAGQRGCSQADCFRSYHTFNFAAYFEESRKPFGNLKTLNDTTLKEDCTLKYIASEDMLVVLIPIVGACEYSSQVAHGTVDVGQSVAFFAGKNSEYQASNPYEGELINFLHIEMMVDNRWSSVNSTTEFNLQKNVNNLIPLFPDSPTAHLNFLIHVGKFNGRAEGVYSVKNPCKRVFSFVIEGAFEFQSRLLHARDGLSLINVDEVEFEALSNEAIVLLIEDADLD